MREWKTIFLVCCFIACALVASSQTEAKIDITVLNPSLKRLQGAEVVLKEESINQQVKARTNTAGVVSFTINAAGEWHTFIDGYEYKTYILTVNEGEVSTNSFEITHNPALNKRLREQVFDRKAMAFVTVPQDAVPNQPARGYVLLNLTVVNSDRKKLIHKKVNVVNTSSKKIYSAVTNAEGTVAFHLPNKAKYDIDVEDQLNVSFFDVDAKEGFTYSKNLVYDTYDMIEAKRNDTLTQNIQLPVEEKNSRALFSVFVTKDGKLLANEKVFLNDVSGASVYKAKTNNEGEAIFLLPFGKKFLVHLPYQRDIDVIDLTEARGRANGELRLTYVPNRALQHPEKFVPTREELFLTDFPYYHRKCYPRPTDVTKPDLSLRSTIPSIRPAGREAILELVVSTKDFQQTRRKPLNLSFVLDISGSMAGYERIESLKSGFIQFIDQLAETDIISIVLFNDNMRLVLPAQQLLKDKKRIIELVKAIEPAGGTNMLNALHTGYEQVLKNYNTGVTNAVILLSDGYDNSNSTETLVKVQQPYIGKVTCAGIGVGKDYNYDLMKKLVTNSEGLLSYANEGKELTDLFANKLMGIAVPVAEQVTVTIDFPVNLICKKVYGLESMSIQARSVSAKLPNLYAGMERPYLVTLAQKAGSAANEGYPITVTLKYTNTETGNKETVTQNRVIRFDNNNDKSTSDEDLKKMYAVAFANECLIAMATSFEKSKLDEARVVLERGLSKLKELYPVADKDISELLYKMKLYETALKNINYKRKVASF